jgi:hypothetical protein
MTKQRILLIFIVLYLGMSAATGQQSIYKTSLQEGLYRTKDDFIQKKSSEFLRLTIEKMWSVNDSDLLAHRCFIINKDTHKRLKKVFAVSHNGYLYFSNTAIYYNKDKKDKSISPVGSMNSFVLVLIGGDNFLYAEGGFVNPWQTGISGGFSNGLAVGGGIAGLIVGNELGKAIDKSYPVTTSFGTGVVWDIKKKEFNLFRSCPDFNDLIEGRSIEKIDCGKQIFELKQIRDIMQIIK